MNLFTKFLIAGPVGVGAAALGKKLNDKRKEWAKASEERRAREAEQYRKEYEALGNPIGPYYIYSEYDHGICCAGYASNDNGRHDLNLMAFICYNGGYFCVACQKRADLIITSSAIQEKIYSLYPMMAPMFMHEAFSRYDDPATLNQWTDDFNAILKKSLFAEPTCKVDMDGYKLEKYLTKFLESNEDDADRLVCPISTFDTNDGKFVFKANFNFWAERVMHYEG